MLNVNEINRFNYLYNKAWELQNNNVLLNENYYVNLKFFQKLRLKKSINLFKKCFKINPLSWPSAWAIGKAYQALEQNKEALRWFEKAYEIDQSNVDIPREISLQCINIGLSEKAVQYAKLAIELNSKDEGLYGNYALALLISKKGQEALDIIIKATKMNSGDKINKDIHILIMDVLMGKKPYPDKIGPYD